MKKSILLILCLSPMILGAAPPNQQNQADSFINQLYHRAQPNMSMTARIKYFSGQFLNRPYILGGLGEGLQGEYDQDPLYRVDGFDCLTYVETVLALAFSNDINGFAQCIRKIRYHHGKISFATRNHFTSLDWNQNNQLQNYVKDITRSIKNKNGQVIAKTATALINKPAWYQHQTEQSIKIENISDAVKKEKLQTLKQTGQEFKAVTAAIPYLPFSQLFDAQHTPNQYIFDQIPDGSIIEIVRPNWDLRKTAGTCLNVSHLGFAVKKDGILMFREASSIKNKTMDVPLIEYLKQALKSPTIKGINVQVVGPDKPLDRNCEVQI